MTVTVLEAQDAVELEDQCKQFIYKDLKPRLLWIKDAAFAVREIGKGPTLVFIHGFPVHGYTWRKLLPTLAQYFRCVIIDLPGLGDSDWNASTDFTFTAQAQRLVLLLNNLCTEEFSIIAQDTGASIARLAALSMKDRLKKLVLINTEIPNHRPPWIGLYQKTLRLPGAVFGFRSCLSSAKFLRSSMGLGAFYSNKLLFDDPDNIVPYIQPLLDSNKKLKGALSYLQGIEWAVVDGLKQQHGDIKADTLFLWGKNDPTFPVDYAKAMLDQFNGRVCLREIENASLMPHEEKPEEVINHVLEFFWDRDYFYQHDSNKESL